RARRRCSKAQFGGHRRRRVFLSFNRRILAAWRRECFASCSVSPTRQPNYVAAFVGIFCEVVCMGLDIYSLRRQRAELVADARGIIDRVEREKREPTTEERGSFDSMMAEADKIESRYSAEERLILAEAELRSTQGRRSEPSQPGRRPDAVGQSYGYAELK